MIIDIEKIDYDYLSEQNIFVITYRNEEFCDLAEKINFLPSFYELVVKNNGEITGLKDNFEFEEDIKNAVKELQDLFNSNAYQNQLFKQFVRDYIDLYGEITEEELKIYLHMLDEESISKILEL